MFEITNKVGMAFPPSTQRESPSRHSLCSVGICSFNTWFAPDGHGGFDFYYAVKSENRLKKRAE
jgi:hypothetical protein